jgi:hypothetical protein
MDSYNGRPNDGLNRGWTNSLGISTGGSRTPLVRGNDARGNIVEFRLKNLIEEQILPGGASFAYGGPVTVAYTNQYGGNLYGDLVYSFNGAGNASVDIYVDSDENQKNGVRKTRSYSLPPTGTVPRTARFSINGVLDGIPPGRYRVGASIDSPSGKRQYYAQEILLITPQLSMQWTTSLIQGEPTFNFLIRGLKASRYALERSEDLTRWERVASGTLTDPGAGEWVGVAVWNGIGMPGKPTGYFRCVYNP